MTVAQAAEYLGITPGVVRYHYDKGHLRGWKTERGTRRIYKDETARHLREEIAGRSRRTPEPL